jgi:hypothetical protein
MEKIFKRPNEPMVLYGNYVKINEPEKILTEDKKLKQLSMMGVFE